MDIVVCNICGSGSSPRLIAKCARCNAYEHCYCMQVLTYVIPHEWHCAECQEYANGCPKPTQGGKTELQKPWHGCDMMEERETPKLHLSQSKAVHQINPRSSNKFGNAKVKFISSEEVASLSRERPPYVRSRFAVQPSKAHQSSPPNTKYLSNLKCISPNRSDTQVQALKRCAASSHDQMKIEDRSYLAVKQRQVHPSSPPSMKQPFNMKSVSPSRSDMRAQTVKRCATASRDQAKTEDRPDFARRQSQVRPASPPHVKQLPNMKCISPNRIDRRVHATKSAAASHDQAMIDDINMKRQARSGGCVSMPMIHRCRVSEPVEVKVDSLIEDKAKEKKTLNADKGEINFAVDDEPKEKGTSCISDNDTGCKSEMERVNQNKGVLLFINSSVEYSRRPPPGICWRGCFHVFDAGAKLKLGEFKAQFPSKVSAKVYEIVKMIPSNLQLELSPRMNDWPKSFETSHPVYEDIGLFFFSNEPDGHEKKHSYLLEAHKNYVLRAHIDGIKLLIYSSEVLPPDSQWIDGENYLWGVFVASKGKSDPR